MDIFQLLNACHQKYSRNGRCGTCQNSDCRSKCSSCLDDIHMNKIKRRYNCQNIVNCYVCKYQIKYSSEIYYLLNNHVQFKSLNDIVVWSIGCGPCSDLFAIANWMQNNNKFNLKYVGFDLNNEWQPIQNDVQSIASRSPVGVNSNILNHNIFTIYRSVSEWPDTLPVNVLFLQYVISDLASNVINSDVDFFLNRTVDLLIKRMPSNSFVIINDINHHTLARNHFEKLINLLRGSGKYSFTRYHFVNNNRQDYIQYGQQHQSNNILWPIPQYCLIHNPWNFCSSAQLVIHKQ